MTGQWEMGPKQADAPGRVAVRGAAARCAGNDAWVAADPAIPAGHFMLNAVAIAAPDQVWAVGQGVSHPLIERWEGSGWKSEAAIALPAELYAAAFQGVDALGPRNAVAVGGAFDRLAAAERPLAYGWDGLAWADLRPPLPGPGCVLTDVAVFAPGDAWAVGSIAGGNGRPLALRWADRAWKAHLMPAVGAGRLFSVAGESPEDVWAVGVAGAGSARRPLIVHFDGREWRQVPCPVEAKLLPRGLVSVAVRPGGEVWAGGGTRVLRWDGRSYGSGSYGWKQYATDIVSVNTVAVSPSGQICAAGKGLAGWDGARFRMLTSRDATALWLGSAAIDDTVWVVGSRQHTDRPMAMGMPGALQGMRRASPGR